MNENNNAIELIKAINFHPKALEVFIETIINQVAISGKDVSGKEPKEQMRSIFTSNSFLKPFAENFKTIFTDQEITCLLEIYQSELMAKMLKHYEELCSRVSMLYCYSMLTRLQLKKHFICLENGMARLFMDYCAQ